MNNQNSSIRLGVRGFAPIAIILIIVGVLALGGGVWYAKNKIKTQAPEEKNYQVSTPPQTQKQTSQQTTTTQQTAKPDETATWKTYRNEEYGFEVKYPNDLNIINKPKALLALETKDSKYEIQKLDGEKLLVQGAVFRIFVDTREKKTISEWSKNREEGINIALPTASISKVNNYIVVVEKACCEKPRIPEGKKWQDVYPDWENIHFYNEKTGIEVTIFFDKITSFIEDVNGGLIYKDNPYKNLYNQILSTFKFIK